MLWINVEQGLPIEGGVDNFVRRHQGKTWTLSTEMLNPSTIDYNITEKNFHDTCTITEKNFHDTVTAEDWRLNQSMNSPSE